MTFLISPIFLARRTAIAAGITVACASGVVHAEDDHRFSIRGFGTIGAVHSDNGQSDYVTNLYQPGGPGRSRSWDVTTDTKAGAQLDAKLADQLSAVLQITSRKLSSNNFTPKVEWANIKYQVTPDFSIRAGRIALSTLMQSDARLVSYTLTPVRVPLEIYNITPPTNSDGIDATYRVNIGKVNNTVQASYGRSDSKLALGIPDGVIVAEANARKIINIADTVEIGDLTLRASYFKSDIHTLGTSFRYDMKALGALYDAGAWFVQSEFAKSNGGGLTKNQEAWYALGGMRVKSFTPYVSYAKSKPQDPLLAGATGFEQTTSSIGVRWDFMSNTALKVQYDHVDAPGVLATQGSSTYFVKQNTGFFLNGGNTNLVSVAVDFVF
ncbi:MAG: porin [Pseudomonadota bacterium]